MNVSIRPASEADADGFAAVHLQGWVEAYSHLLSPDFFAGRDPAVMAERWRATFGAPDPAVEYLVADVDGDIVGIASAGHGRGDDPPRPDELYMIYVLAAHYGTGVGQALLDSALDTLPAFLWVAEDNPRAHAFYRRNGFALDGARDTIEKWENMAEVRMVRWPTSPG